MSEQRLKELIIQIADQKEKLTTYVEYERLNAIYTALKTQWNKKTGNKLIDRLSS